MTSKILQNFPKVREDLPDSYKEIYDLHYKRNRQGETKATSLSMKMEQWLHKTVAKDVQNTDKKTLEIGGGTLNQLDYEPTVSHYDVVEPFKALYKDRPQKELVNHFYNDILEVESNNTYQRIISIATFEHILDLPVVIAKAALLLKDNGSLRISIPNEGTLMWNLGTLVTGAEFKKMYGLDYNILLKYEHVNTAKEIETVLKYFFNTIKTRVFGLNKSLAFYVFILCENPHIEKAQEYLKSRGIDY